MEELKTKYIEERILYNKVLNATQLISLNQHGINTDGRGVRGMKIFTRQTITGMSLSKLLPREDFYLEKDVDFWDISSIASLSRNILEGFLSLHFFGLEKVSPQEAELRFFILQLHRNTEWYNIRKVNNQGNNELIDFEKGIPEQKERIKNHIYINKLPEVQRKRALRGIEIYKTKADFEKELSFCKNLRKTYRLLSNLVHPLPLSIERTDNDRGRGERNGYDMSYVIISMMIARCFLAASTVGIVDLFSNPLGRRFNKEINSIRPLIENGFEE